MKMKGNFACASVCSAHQSYYKKAIVIYMFEIVCITYNTCSNYITLLCDVHGYLIHWRNVLIYGLSLKHANLHKFVILLPSVWLYMQCLSHAYIYVLVSECIRMH